MRTEGLTRHSIAKKIVWRNMRNRKLKNRILKHREFLSRPTILWEIQRQNLELKISTTIKLQPDYLHKTVATDYAQQIVVKKYTGSSSNWKKITYREGLRRLDFGKASSKGREANQSSVFHSLQFDHVAFFGNIFNLWPLTVSPPIIFILNSKITV